MTSIPAEGPPPGVHLELDTFADPIALGEGICTWVEHARLRIVEPVVERLQASDTSAYAPATEWGAPHGLHVGFSEEDAKSGRIRAVDFTPEAWSDALDRLRKGRLRRLIYSARALDATGAPSIERGAAFVVADLRSREFDDAASVLAVNVSRTLYDGIDPDVQRVWVELATGGAVEFAAVTGYITIDHVADATPFEQSVGRSWQEGHAESDRLLRGYYWGNFLSAEHIRRLGGIDRIRSEAPCFLIQDLSGDHGGLAYLQLTPELDEVSDEKLAALKDYFDPALPTAEPGFEYIGLPLRIV